MARLRVNTYILTSCAGKQTFKTAAAAWRTVRRRNSRAKNTDPLSPYRCRYCTQWHLGSQLTEGWAPKRRPRAVLTSEE